MPAGAGAADGVGGGVVSTDRALIERAAKAAFYAFGHGVAADPRLSWEDAPEDFRITFRMVADAVLMVTEQDPS